MPRLNKQQVVEKPKRPPFVPRQRLLHPRQRLRVPKRVQHQPLVVRLRREKLFKLLKNLQIVPLPQVRPFAKQVVLFRADVPLVRPLKMRRRKGRAIAPAPRHRVRKLQI